MALSTAVSLQGHSMGKALRGRWGILAVLLAWSLMAWPVSIFAQYYDDPGLGSRPVAAHPQDYKPLGIRAGSFMLHPGVQLAGEYTDNVFYTQDDEQSDTVLHIRPYISAQSTWNRHSLNVSLAADVARYQDFGFRDYEDYFFGINGQIDVKNRSYFTYALDYMDLHEDLNSRISEQGLEPTRYSLSGGSLGYDHTFNRLSLGFKYTYESLDFDNAIGFDGDIINNNDRDRSGNTWLARAGYQFQTDKQLYVSYAYYDVDYDQRLDRNSFARSGDGYTASVGLSFAITGKLNGELYGSYHDRSYDDPALSGLSGWAAGASLQWKPTYLTSVYGNISSSVEETTNRYSSGILQTVYSVRVDHELLRFLQLNAFASYRDGDHELIEGAPASARDHDKVYRYGLGANWFINRHMYLNASYGHEKLKTNVAADGYQVNRVWLVLGLEY